VFHITAATSTPTAITRTESRRCRLHTQPLMIAAIRTMQLLGGVMMHHGYTHQYSNIANPIHRCDSDDCEFYRITASNGVLTYVGPLPEDTDPAGPRGDSPLMRLS